MTLHQAILGAIVSFYFFSQLPALFYFCFEFDDFRRDISEGFKVKHIFLIYLLPSLLSGLLLLCLVSGVEKITRLDFWNKKIL